MGTLMGRKGRGPQQFSTASSGTFNRPEAERSDSFYGLSDRQVQEANDKSKSSSGDRKVLRSQLSNTQTETPVGLADTHGASADFGLSARQLDAVNAGKDPAELVTGEKSPLLGGIEEGEDEDNEPDTRTSAQNRSKGGSNV